ncbi:integrase core domain-containing protein, partial [Corynebacterium sp.]|uniref:integrase core domain-containing protein n=1 Tax=Corynebacterium sp. TaxID=1720 RepID=UPI003B3A376B
DNGACYRSHAFNNALGGDIKHRFTRAYRPQTNGKVERFNRTLMSEWVYARLYLSESSREAVYDQFLHYCNHHRSHTVIGGSAPSTRVHHLTRSYI